MNEWEFTAEAASWINEALAFETNPFFARAKCEQRGRGSNKRRDLSLLGKDQKPLVTGEVKLPFRPDGGTPYNAHVVEDARKKARRAGADFFFTWNVNQCVLWETEPSEPQRAQRNYFSWDVTDVVKESHLENPAVVHAICSWIPVFLRDVERICRGTDNLGEKLPDEKFIEALESALRLPVALTVEKLQEQYANPRFRKDINQWMREEQGWVIYDDPEGVRDSLERAARFACYALVNKIVFHEALLKRHSKRMEKLTVPDHISGADELRLELERFFGEAKEVTGDYETVFGEDHTGIGNRIPFYADAAVPHWRALINQVHDFDFSKLDYEVIGSIFERLISPEERHKFGQFYTRVEVVDLVNSFCIRDGGELVMDPACGGGTFLVRAYARKRELSPRRTHARLLGELFGVDVSHFATHLTTINLATRDLIDDENYPQVARSDFFDVEVNKTFAVLPAHIKARGLGKAQSREILVPPLDAVVGNPPYIRQEDIPKSKTKGKEAPQRGTKDFYLHLAKRVEGAALSGRSDIHCYFWPHAATFLKEDGHLCFLTSSQWLDVEYGFRLQEWILRNFEIVAIFESLVEPWFVGARVATAVTILRRQSDAARRMANTVRFVQIRRSMQEIMGHDGTTAGAVRAANDFRDEILSAEADASNAHYRIRLVRQGDLWQQGVKLGVMMGKYQKSGDEAPDSQNGDYYGGKWGVRLRAPDLWFNLLDECGSRFAPLGDIATLWRGVTTGKDSFFFPVDCSSECLKEHLLPEEFEIAYGVGRDLVKSGKVKLVRCGDKRGEIKPIESEYLEPEVHSLMEVKGFAVSPEDCSRMILLAPTSEDLAEHVRAYIAWGEEQGYHEGATCASRVTEIRRWYDLTGHKRGDVLWSKAQQYRHVAPMNDEGLQCNCNLYDIHLPEGIPLSTMAGILNSTWVVLSKYQYGRPVGVEGNLKTEVVDVNLMLVPDPRQGTKTARRKVAAAFEKMKSRPVLAFLSERRLREMAFREKGKEDQLDRLSDECELDMEDRWELDEAVLELLGIRSRKRRQELVGELYRYLRDFFEWTREKEEQAIANKKKAKRRGAAQPGEIAAQIFDEIANKHGRLLRRYDFDFVDCDKPYDTFELPAAGEAERHKDLHQAHGVRFVAGKRKKPVAIVETKIPEQDELLALVANSGVRGLVRAPHEPEECRRVCLEYSRFLQTRERKLRELVEERTADEELQEKVLEALVKMLNGGRRLPPVRGVRW